MIHLITIRRPFPARSVCTDHCFYYVPATGLIEEWRTVFSYPAMILQPHLCKLAKKSDAPDFVINLLEMIEHPGIVYKNLDAIRWYASAVEQDII